MRIGIVTGEYPPMQGGVGAYTAILAQHLIQSNQEVFVFSTNAAQSESIPLTNVISHWNSASLNAIATWAQQQRLDLINLQFQTAAFAMSPWIHFLPDFVRSTPIVTTFHDLRFPYLFPKAGPLRDWIVMHLARRSAGIILTNHEDAARTHRIQPSCLIPIGSNILAALPANYTPADWRERAGAQPDDLLLVNFGLINRSKGLDTLMGSLSDLRSSGLPARLLIIGGTSGSSDPTNAAYQVEIDQIITDEKLEPYIHRTGYINSDAEVGAYLSASDAVVLPFQDGASFRRGTLMAALQYGCPIVTTQPQVPIQEFVSGENMLFVPPDDQNALTNTLNRLHHDADLRDRLRAGATQLAQRFDWQHIAQDYIAFFEQVLQAA